ncbi:MAG: ribosome maturation factor RimP [Gammaproteobacteria bacterium]|nr:ribosome maturation factor RimP [Gammaproteobacteria bacterium]
MRKIDPVLHERLEKLLRSMGYELVGCELLPLAGQMVFRIYMDGPEGVTLDDCSKASHQISAMMDVDDPIQGRYTLEVSSPGIDRPLFELEHYRKYLGKQVKIRLHSAIGERRQYKGTIQRIEGENIFLLIEDLAQEVKLPFSAIEKANLVGDIHFQGTESGRRKANS